MISYWSAPSIWCQIGVFIVEQPAFLCKIVIKHIWEWSIYACMFCCCFVFMFFPPKWQIMWIFIVENCCQLFVCFAFLPFADCDYIYFKSVSFNTLDCGVLWVLLYMCIFQHFVSPIRHFEHVKGNERKLAILDWQENNLSILCNGQCKANRLASCVWPNH